jgi:hypothetical protein
MLNSLPYVEAALMWRLAQELYNVNRLEDSRVFQRLVALADHAEAEHIAR